MLEKNPVSASPVPRVGEGLSLTFPLGSAQTAHIGIPVAQSFIPPGVWVRDTSTRGRRCPGRTVLLVLSPSAPFEGEGGLWEDGFICKCKYWLSERARD